MAYIKSVFTLIISLSMDVKPLPVITWLTLIDLSHALSPLAKGFTHKENVDDKKTFALVARMVTIKNNPC